MLVPRQCLRLAVRWVPSGLREVGTRAARGLEDIPAPTEGQAGGSRAGGGSFGDFFREKDHLRP